MCVCVCVLLKPWLWCVLQDTDTLWLDFHQNITDKSLLCVDTYLSQFPDIKVWTFALVLF